MLSHQRWPYVGRFARGWHRLPGRIPGQPQTRTRARLRIGGASRTAQRPPPAGDRAGRGDRVHLRRTGLAEHVGSRSQGRARRQHVVDEQDPRRRGTARPEHPVHRHPPLGARALRLRRGRDRATELPPGRALGHAGERDGERARLVVSALRAPAPRERHPRDDVDVGDTPGARDRVGEGRGDVTPARELQPQDRAARRPVVDERRSHRRQRRRRTVLARRLWPVGRIAAPFAPRRFDRPQPRRTVRTERPRPRAAPGARPWEQGVEHPDHHRATLPTGTDTGRYGSHMRTMRWASMRSIALTVILALQSLAFAGLAFSLLVVGSITGAMLDEFFFDGGHRITITMLTLGSVSLVACVAAATAAIAVGAGLGYRGAPHAALWRTIVGVGAIVQVGWIVMVAGSGGDPGIGGRAGWCVALAAG